MGTVRMRYTRKRRGCWFWEPTKAMKAKGVAAEALGPDDGKAFARAAELNKLWDEIRAGRPKEPAARSFAQLVVKFQKSDWYANLGEGEQKAADRILAKLDKGLGADALVKDIDRARCRRIFNMARDAKGDDYGRRYIRWLRRALNYAIELGWITHNPASEMKLKGYTPRRQRWTPAEVDAFVKKALAKGLHGWAIAVRLGYDTSQRQSNILGATWGAFDGEGITFPGQKGGKPAWCPLEKETIKLLKEEQERNRKRERPSMQIVTGKGGKPIAARRWFHKTFCEILDEAGLSSPPVVGPDGKERKRQLLQFMDLRRTAISEVFAGGGRAEPLSGHTPGSPVLRVYEVPDKTGAKNAARARRRARKTSTESER